MEIYANKSEIEYFTHIFLNVNISVTIKGSHLIFSMTFLDIMSEGTVSQILYIRPSFHFMECRKYYYEKKSESFPFSIIKYKLGPK